MLEDLAVRREELREQLDSVNDERSFESRIIEQIREIDKVLGDSEGLDDPMWDHWEAQLEAGEMPDF